MALENFRPFDFVNVWIPEVRGVQGGLYAADPTKAKHRDVLVTWDVDEAVQFTDREPCEFWCLTQRIPFVPVSHSVPVPRPLPPRSYQRFTVDVDLGLVEKALRTGAEIRYQVPRGISQTARLVSIGFDGKPDGALRLTFEDVFGLPVDRNRPPRVEVEMEPLRPQVRFVPTNSAKVSP